MQVFALVSIAYTIASIDNSTRSMNNDLGGFFAIDAFLSQKILAITVFVHEMKPFRLSFCCQEINNLWYYIALSLDRSQF